MEEQVRRFGLERDAAHFVDYEQRNPAQFDQFLLRPAGGVGVGEAGDPLGGGGGQDSVSGLAGADGQADVEMGLAGVGQAGEHRIRFARNDIQRAEMAMVSRLGQRSPSKLNSPNDLRAGNGAARMRPPALGLAGGDFALQAGDEELFVGPGFGAGLLGHPGHALARGWVRSAHG